MKVDYLLFDQSNMQNYDDLDNYLRQHFIIIATSKPYGKILNHLKIYIAQKKNQE